MACAMKRLLVIFFFAATASLAGAQVQYQFNDTPRPEADVMVARYVLQIRGSEMWLVGRVFNRGLKPARNVRINPNLTGKHGTRPPGMTIYLNSDVPPTSFAEFQGRVALFADPEITAQPTAEWNQ